MEEDKYEKLRIQTWHSAYDCFAMKYIFEKRGEQLRFKSNLLKAFGVVVPAIVGIIAISYGSDNVVLKYFIVAAIVLMVIQFTISVLAMVYKWDDELAYCYEAVQTYNPLYTKYKNLANLPPASYDELKAMFDAITLESAFREQQDALHRVKDWEQRLGMRASLRQHQCKCVGCHSIPTSMQSTDCDICGKFSLNYRTFYKN